MEQQPFKRVEQENFTRDPKIQAMLAESGWGGGGQQLKMLHDSREDECMCASLCTR